MKKSSIQYQLKIPSQTENLELIRDFVYKLAARLGFEDEEASRIELAVDEACTNVIKHAYRGESEELIDIAIKIDYKKMSIIVTDHGKGFDPSSVDMPEMKEYLAELRVGGLGIFLMRTIMDEVKYDVHPGKGNQVTMVKYLVKDDKVVSRKKLRTGKVK